MLQQSNNTITSIYPIGNQTEELTALYCRLSQDDKQEGDSNSIINHFLNLLGDCAKALKQLISNINFLILIYFYTIRFMISHKPSITTSLSL